MVLVRLEHFQQVHCLESILKSKNHRFFAFAMCVSFHHRLLKYMKSLQNFLILKSLILQPLVKQKVAISSLLHQVSFKNSYKAAVENHLQIFLSSGASQSMKLMFSSEKKGISSTLLKYTRNLLQSLRNQSSTFYSVPPIQKRSNRKFRLQSKQLSRLL